MKLSTALVLFGLLVANSSPGFSQGIFKRAWGWLRGGIFGTVFNPDMHCCYCELGCLNITADWYDPIARPINRLPQQREVVNTTFNILSPNTSDEFIQVNPEKDSLLANGFDPFKPVKFICHGYFDRSSSVWPKQVAKALHTAGEFNTIAVGWEIGALNLYTQATANTWIVGQEIALFARFLEKEFGVELDDIHCIGHSLGSHVCGFAGQALKGELGRITGLDPAGPLFQFMPPQVRLDPSDAKFVDVIHTDGRTDLSLGFGMVQPCGHMDLYPNNGQLQPGCDPDQIPPDVFLLGGIDTSEREIFACNHHRAIHFFINAVKNTKCRFVGHACNNFREYQEGKCGSCKENETKCAVMGLDADKYNIGNRTLVKFYLSTTDEKHPTYCARHYVTTLQVAFPKDKSDLRIVGNVKLDLDGTIGNFSDYTVIRHIDSTDQDNLNLTFLVTNPTELGLIKRVKVHWKSVADTFFGHILYKARCLLTLGCNYKMFVEKVTVTDMDWMRAFSPKGSSGSESQSFCGNPESTNVTEIASGSSAYLQNRC